MLLQRHSTLDISHQSNIPSKTSTKMPSTCRRQSRQTPYSRKAPRFARSEMQQDNQDILPASPQSSSVQHFVIFEDEMATITETVTADNDNSAPCQLEVEASNSSEPSIQDADITSINRHVIGDSHRASFQASTANARARARSDRRSSNHADLSVDLDHHKSVKNKDEPSGPPVNKAHLHH